MGGITLLAGGTVVVAMAALTLLPALLSLLGDRVDAGRLIGRRRPVGNARETAWWRFVHRVSCRPWPYLVAASAVLLALATPALQMETGLECVSPQKPCRADGRIVASGLA